MKDLTTIPQRLQLVDKFVKMTNQDHIYYRHLAELFSRYTPFELYESIEWFSSPYCLKHADSNVFEAAFTVSIIKEHLLTIHAKIAGWQVRGSRDVKGDIDNMLGGRSYFTSIRHFNLFLSSYIGGVGGDIELAGKECVCFMAIRDLFMNLHEEEYNTNKNT